MRVALWHLSSGPGRTCIPRRPKSEPPICGIAFTLMQLFVFAAAHEGVRNTYDRWKFSQGLRNPSLYRQEWSCRYTSYGEILCRKQLIQKEASIRSQKSSENTGLHTEKQFVPQDNQTKANILQRAKYRKFSRCIGGCPTVDQAKHFGEDNEYRRLEHYFGELLQRAMFKGSQQDIDRTNRALRIPEQYSSGKQIDNSFIAEKNAARLLRHKFAPSFESVLEQELRVQNIPNVIQTQCTQQILKTMAPYVLHRLAQCNRKQEVNAARLRPHKTQNPQHQQAAQNKEGTLQWPPNVALEREHIPTQGELLYVNAAVKEAGKATFENKRHQRYKANLVHTRSQQDAIAKYLANIIISYIRKQHNMEEIDVRKMPAAETKNQMKSKVGAQLESEARYHRAAPVRYQTQHKFSALRQSNKKSVDSWPIFDTSMLTSYTEEMRKRQAAMKSETPKINNIQTLKPIHQPFRESSNIVYNGESALNQQRAWHEGLVHGTPEHDAMRHYSANAQNKAHLRSRNSTTANRSAQRKVKQAVRANSQYRHQQRTDIGSKKFLHFSMYATPGGQTLGGFLLSPHRQHKHKPDDSKPAKQQLGKNLLLHTAKERGHEHVAMERQENSVELSQKNPVQENRAIGSQVTNGKHSDLVKTTREVTRNKQPTRLQFQKQLTVGNPHNDRPKPIFRPQRRLIFRPSLHEGILHKAPRVVQAGFRDHSNANFRRFAQRSRVHIPAAGPSPARAKQLISQHTQNGIFSRLPQKVSGQNSKPLAATEKQDNLIFNHQTAPFRTLKQQQTTVEKQASKQKEIIQKTGRQQKKSYVIDKSRQGNSQQISMPFPRAVKPQRTVFNGRMNSVKDVKS